MALPTPPTPPPPATEADVAAEVQAEIEAQTGPLEAEASQLAAQETRAIQDLQELFSGIMPFVQGSAERVAQMYGATNQAQESIFAQAWARLNALDQQRAQEGQQLAQQLGAPIPLSMFTKGTEGEMGLFVPEAAGELLKASTIGAAGTAEAEAFAGRVFPLQNVRLQKETHNYFRDQIVSIQKEIASLKKQKPGMVNERLRQRQLEDYQMKLDRYQAQYDMWSTQQSLALEKRRLKLEEDTLAENTNQSNLDRNQRDKLNKQQKTNVDLQYRNNMKTNIVTVSNALWTGQSGTQKMTFIQRDKAGNPMFDPVTGKVLTYTVDVQTGGGRVRNPGQLLRLILSQIGISSKQTILYNFAVQQVRRLVATDGYYRDMPTNPTQWDSWWKRKTTPKPKPKPKSKKTKPPASNNPATGGPEWPVPPGR